MAKDGPVFLWPDDKGDKGGDGGGCLSALVVFALTGAALASAAGWLAWGWLA